MKGPLKRTALVTAVFGIVGVLVVTAASACHAVVTASENCSGLVSYTITAWNGNPRSNNDVSVTANGTKLPAGVFNAADNYTFTGTYQAPTQAPVTVTAAGIGQWYGTGSPVTDTTSTSVQVSPSTQGCAKPTVTTPVTTSPAVTVTTPPVTDTVTVTQTVTSPAVTVPGPTVTVTRIVRPKPRIVVRKVVVTKTVTRVEKVAAKVSACKPFVKKPVKKMKPARVTPHSGYGRG